MDLQKLEYLYDVHIAWMGRRIKRSYKSKENVAKKSAHYISREQLESFKFKLQKNIYSQISQLEIEGWVTPEPVEFVDRKIGTYKKLPVGTKWGDLFDCGWFHVTGKLPENTDRARIVGIVDFSGEGSVVNSNGTPTIGLTSVLSGFAYYLGVPGKREIPLREMLNAEDKIDFWIDAACNDLFGNLKGRGKVQESYLAIRNEEIHTLFYDFEVLLSLIDGMDPDKVEYSNELIKKLREAQKIATPISNKTAQKAHEFLQSVFDQKSESELNITAIGHSHLDLAWLWPIRETKRKGGRTFSTALNMMERYPEYIFGASQAQLYLWMKEKYPELYEKIRQRIKEKRWEVQGAFWVEPDTNVPSGESLVRQIQYGKKYFMDEFGLDMKVLWLPDTFGYSGALPQIMKQGGIDYFMTQKLSWNDTNKFPYKTFNWHGIDGTEVLSHMPPDDTYNSPITPYQLRIAEKGYPEAKEAGELLMLYGIGDGGGGPGIETHERTKRMKSLKGLPTVKQGFSIDMFKRLEKNQDKYPHVNGELYLEKHQGTYTSQAKNKKYNRLMEISLMQCEFAMVISELLDIDTFDPTTLHEIWQEVLLYQFHDILPGSSIKRVYDESVARYEILYADLQERMKSILSKIAAKINGGAGNTVVFNPLSWERTEFVEHNGKFYPVTVPAMGYATVNLAENHTRGTSLTADEHRLENDLIRVTFNPDGTIHHIFDKEANREIIANGKEGNKFTLYTDKGDAWDIKPKNYRDKPKQYAKLVSKEFFVENHVAYFVHNYQIGVSAIQQKVMIFENSKRIEFRTTVDWQETHKMLRVAFPVNVKSDVANYNIQFGHLARPTKHDTSIDKAKYETCGQKWVDLSESDYGVSLLNDCKYGHQIWDNVLDLNLLRSSTYPGKDADKGQQEFTYALYPHTGDLSESNTYRESYQLNVPLVVIDTHENSSSLETVKSFIEIDNPHIIVETFKKCEDGSGYVLRTYNGDDKPNPATIKLNGSTAKCVADLMENELEPLSGNVVKHMYKPFEIRTIKVVK